MVRCALEELHCRSQGADGRGGGEGVRAGCGSHHKVCEAAHLAKDGSRGRPSRLAELGDVPVQQQEATAQEWVSCVARPGEGGLSRTT